MIPVNVHRILRSFLLQILHPRGQQGVFRHQIGLVDNTRHAFGEKG